jgi:hypothetical protein
MHTFSMNMLILITIVIAIIVSVQKHLIEWMMNICFNIDLADFICIIDYILWLGSKFSREEKFYLKVFYFEIFKACNV